MENGREKKYKGKNRIGKKSKVDLECGPAQPSLFPIVSGNKRLLLRNHLVFLCKKRLSSNQIILQRTWRLNWETLNWLTLKVYCSKLYCTLYKWNEGPFFFLFFCLLLLTHFGESPVCENLFPPTFWHN